MATERQKRLRLEVERRRLEGISAPRKPAVDSTIESDPIIQALEKCFTVVAELEAIDRRMWAIEQDLLEMLFPHHYVREEDS